MMDPADQRSRRARIRVVVSDARGRAIDRGLASWLSRVAPRSARGTVNVAIVSDTRVRALNKQYRRIDHPTDVLSFPNAPPQRTRRTRRSISGRSKTGSVSFVSSVVELF